MNTATAQSGEPFDLNDLVARVEQRVEHGGARERRLLENARLLRGNAAYFWPADATEGYRLSLRLLRLADALHREAAQARETALDLAELALSRMHRSLEELNEAPADAAEQLCAFWQTQTVLPRSLVEEMVVDAASDSLLKELVQVTTKRLRQRATDEAGILIHANGARTPDFHLFLARLQSELGQLDESFATLDEAFEADGFVLETAASMLIEQGELEQAIQHLEKAALVSETPQLLQEQLYELYCEIGNQDAAISVLTNLLKSTHEILYWNILIQELDENPKRLQALRDKLAEDMPGLHIEIMMQESDARGVAKAARGKNFTAEELWSIGHYLKSVRPAASSKLFLRALALAGADSQSRAECADLGEHVEAAMSFFAERDSVDRLQKAFQQALAHHKKNIPLEREYERIFG